MNVYDAFLARAHFLFEEFDHIYVSFSGGKDSGLLLNLVLDYRNQHYPERTIGVFHQDFEAQYTVTTEYGNAPLSESRIRLSLIGFACLWPPEPH